MSKLRKVRYFIEYIFALIFYAILRLMPYKCLKLLSFIGQHIAVLSAKQKTIVEANIRVAFPELSSDEIRAIGKKSIYNMIFNLLEFFWLNGNAKRIEKYYSFAPESVKIVHDFAAKGGRIIFVNPHLGSWEASSAIAPYFGNVEMAAVARPVRNPYLNKMLNKGKREKVKGLHVIFAHGAVRASISALKAGQSIGILIDQNTKVREGGEFLPFFGMPVPTSTTPAVLANYCEMHNIPIMVVCGASIRESNGKIVAHMDVMKPLSEYSSNSEFTKDLLKLTENYIRKYPEQYLWLYKRFNFIPPDTPDEIRKRFPSYARVAKPNFFGKVKAQQIFK